MTFQIRKTKSKRSAYFSLFKIFLLEMFDYLDQIFLEYVHSHRTIFPKGSRRKEWAKVEKWEGACFGQTWNQHYGRTKEAFDVGNSLHTHVYQEPQKRIFTAGLNNNLNPSEFCQKAIWQLYSPKWTLQFHIVWNGIKPIRDISTWIKI